MTGLAPLHGQRELRRRAVLRSARARVGALSLAAALAAAGCDRQPLAFDDRATTGNRGPLRIEVLANDRGLGDRPIATSPLSEPSFGSVAANPDNSLTYTPDGHYVGQDRFIYGVIDSDGDVATATVTLETTCADCPPERSVHLAWQAVPGPVRGYLVQLEASPGRAASQISDLPAAPLAGLAEIRVEYEAWNDLGLREGERACFTIRAYNRGGLSRPSAATCVEL